MVRLCALSSPFISPFAHIHTFFVPLSLLFLFSLAPLLFLSPSFSRSGVGVFRRRRLRRRQHHVRGGLRDSLHLQPGLVSQQPSGAPVAVPLCQLLLLHVLLCLPLTHSLVYPLLPVSSVEALQPGPSQHGVAVRLRPHLAGARASQRVQRSVFTGVRPGERWAVSVPLNKC